MSAHIRLAARLNNAGKWHRIDMGPNGTTETHITTRCGRSAPQDWWRFSPGGGIDCRDCKAMELTR